MRLFTKENIENLLKINKRKFYVYGLWRSDARELFYIGKGFDFRALDHLNKKSKYNPHKDRIIKKVGKDNIKFWIKFCDSEEVAFREEIRLIKEYRKTLCNITDGGEGASGRKMSKASKDKLSLARLGKSYIMSEETKHKISQGNKGKKGKPMSEEIKHKISQYRKGKKHSEETKQKIKNWWTKRKMSEDHKGKKGKPMSEELKKKLLSIHTGRTRSEETKTKMREAWKRREAVSEETKIKISGKIKIYWKNKKKLFNNH